MGFLQGKRALVTGIASQRSIATGIADTMHREGAELALTCRAEAEVARVEDAAAGYGSKIVLPLDVADDGQIDACFDELGKHWSDGFDILVHCIAFAPREAIEGDFLDGVNRERFHVAHDISAYSLAALGKAARPLMKGRNGSILTLSYLGAERAGQLQHDGRGQGLAGGHGALHGDGAGPGRHRVNRDLGRPDPHLAASGVANFRKMLSQFEAVAPLRRVVTIEDVGNTAAFLCSSLANGITGEITYVDAGYNIMGMSGIEVNPAAPFHAKTPGNAGRFHPDYRLSRDYRRSSATLIWYLARADFT